MFSRRLTRPLAVSASALAIAGGAYGIVSETASNGPAPAAAATASASRHPGLHSGSSNARSGPAAGGTVGTVATVSTSGFTLTTPGQQKVTVTKVSPATVVKKGKSVLVLGTVNGTTIIASKVISQATSGSAKSSEAGVVAFQQGTPSLAKQAGQIPANYSQGSGTIVSGKEANKATEAALAAYPGGIVDRVVKLSNGEDEVHNIGVNWPHHIFVKQNFKVAGAD
jgi:hypothetical protein